MTASPRVTASDTIEELLARQPGAARVLVGRGMHCVGCAIAPFETIQDACAVYGVSVEELFAALDRSATPQRTTQP